MIRSFPTQDDLTIHPGTLASDGTYTDADHARMCLDFVYDLCRDFENRDKLMRQVDDVIYLRQKVHIPENFQKTAIEVRSPLPTHIANSITAALSINTPKVIFDPTEFGDAGYDHAEYRQAFFESAWHTQQLEKNRQLYRLFMYSVVTKGIGILKTVERRKRAWAKYTDYSKSLMKDLGKQRQSGEIDQHNYDLIFDAKTEKYKMGQPYPIETSDIPPETFYYQMGEDGFTRCVEVKSVPYYQTLTRYNCGLDSKGRVTNVANAKQSSFDNVTSLPLPEQDWHKVFSPTDRRYIQMVEVWDCEEQTIILRGPGDIPSARAGYVGSGLTVARIKHNYGDLTLGKLNGPYFMASGITTPSRLPEYGNMGVLFAYLHLFPLLNSLLTMQSQAAFSTAYPAYKRTTPPTFGLQETPFGYDARELQENKKQIIPGGIFPADIVAMDQPHTSIDLDKAIQVVRALIERALPDSVQGVMTGDTAGYALNQASHLASLQWSPIVTNAEMTLSARTGFESNLLDNNIGETVYVHGALPLPTHKFSSNAQYKSGWIGMNPKILGGIHTYEVKLEAASVNSDQLQLRVLKDELDLRLIDPAEAIRQRGRNPVAVERAWLLHALKQDPAIQEQLKQRVFKRMATIDQQAMLGIPEGGEPKGPPAPTSGQPAGATPGISQGLPATGFVPPSIPAQPGVPVTPPPPPGGNLPQAPGPVPGSPGGIRGAPALHSPVPGE